MIETTIIECIFYIVQNACTHVLRCPLKSLFKAEIFSSPPSRLEEREEREEEEREEHFKERLRS